MFNRAASSRVNGGLKSICTEQTRKWAYKDVVLVKTEKANDGTRLLEKEVRTVEDNGIRSAKTSRAFVMCVNKCAGNSDQELSSGSDARTY